MYLKQFQEYDHFKWISRKFYGQDKTGYVRRYKNALEEISVPYSKKGFFSYLEKINMYPDLKCKIAVVWKIRFPSHISMAMHVQSPYFAIINHVWLRKIEAGIRSRIKDWNYGKFKVICPKESRQKPLGYSTANGPLVVLVIGIISSIVIVFIEATFT